MPERSETLLKAALQARREGRHQDAKRDLVEAVDLCRKSGPRTELARALTALGQIERDLHHTEAALQHYEEAVAIYRAEGSAEEGNDLRLAHTLRHVGDIQRSAGHVALAGPCYDEAFNAVPRESANHATGLGKHHSRIGHPQIRYRRCAASSLALDRSSQSLCEGWRERRRRRKRAPTGSSDSTRGRLTPADALD